MIIKKKNTKKQINYRKARFTSRNNCGNCSYLNGDNCDIIKGKTDIFHVCNHHKKENWYKNWEGK